MAEASETPITALLQTLTSSLESAIQIAPEEEALRPPPEELSLLTTKNELFLSYIQNLVFLIVLKLRSCSIEWNDAESQDLKSLNQEIVEKLAELRLYLEKGIKPLESRLKYQIDKVLRATEDATTTRNKPKVTKQSAIHDPSDSSAESVSDDSDSEVENLAAQPNVSSLLRPNSASRDGRSTKTDSKNSSNNNIYRPPKITPTALPTTIAKEDTRKAPRAKSGVLDEFIASELSTAPLAEPSIGSTIRAGGRHTLSTREREKAAERTRYEEENFTRLPTGKKEKTQRGRAHNTFGGEEWRNIGAGLDRIGKMARKSGDRNVLERSRKRAVVDGPRDSGEGTSIVSKRARR